MSATCPSIEQLVRDALSAIESAKHRWAAVVVVGYAADDVRTLGEAADLTTDSANDIYGMAVSWLVVDTTTGESREGGKSQRAAALRALRHHYDPDPDLGHDASAWKGERMVLVSQGVRSGCKAYRLTEVSSSMLAFRLASAEVLEGWLPIAIADLDLRRMTELQIVPPVVMPAKGQGTIANPLEQ